MSADPRESVIERRTITSDPVEARIVAAQNDRFRRELLRSERTVPGRIVLAREVTDRGTDFVTAALLMVAVYTFAVPEDPRSKRDFGSVWVLGERLSWRIDLEDVGLSTPARDRADPSRTIRTLRVMFAREC